MLVRSPVTHLSFGAIKAYRTTVAMQLEWSRHSEQVVSAIRGLQEADQQSLKDVTLSAGGRQLRAHRLMLAAASDYFKVQDSTKRRAKVA